MDDFYTRCRKKSADCTFTPEEEKERFVEQLLASTPIEDFKKWLLAQKADVTIETVLNEGRKHETTHNSIKHINDRGNSTTTPANIDAVCYKCRGQQYNKKGKPRHFVNAVVVITKRISTAVLLKTQNATTVIKLDIGHNSAYSLSRDNHLLEQQTRTQRVQNNDKHNNVTSSINM